MEALVARIEAESGAIVRRVLDETYANPFWEARYGARGRKMAEQDARYHLAYLAEALAANDDQILATYARWLQSVLVSRGMCSRHIAENLDRMARAVESLVEGAGPAVTMLAAARAALRHPEGPAREIQDAAMAIADRAAAQLYAEHPDWGGDRDRCKDDLLYHLDYLADAVASARPELFAAHMRWLAKFLARLEVPVEHLAAALDALARAAGGLGPEARAEIDRMVARAHEGIAAP